MASLFFRRPRILLLLIALISVAGLSALSSLPRAEDPELTGRNASVSTAFPGADAERVEALVTDVIEDGLESMEEIHELLSTSRAGHSTVLVELADEVTDADPVWAEIRDKLGELELELPRGARPPELEEFTVTAFTRLVALVPEQPAAADHWDAQLGRLAEELADQLRAVAGTRDVELFGRQTEELLVDVDVSALAARGLSVEDVSGAIRTADAKIDAGVLRGTDANLFVKVHGELDGLDRLRRLPIRTGPHGEVLRLEDLATIRRATREHQADRAQISGRPGVVVAARVKDAARIDLWAERSDEALAGFEAGLPHGIRMQLIFDQTRYTNARLESLFVNFVTAIGLVMLVLLLTMGWRSALLVGASLPLVTFMVLFGMRQSGIPMNQMSIAGLIIALGLLIDNGIVMVDQMHRSLAKARAAADGRSHSSSAVGLAAMQDAIGHLLMPLLGSTLTTALAFMPIVLMPGASGEFVGAMAINVILAIASSLLVALTILPPLAALIDGLLGRRAGPRNPDPSSRARILTAGYSSPTLSSVGRRLTTLLVRRPALGIACGLFLPLLGFLGASGLEEQFFPPADRDHFSLELELSPTATIEQTSALAEEARTLLMAHEQVTDLHWFLGRHAPKFYYNQLETRVGEPNFAAGLVTLASSEGTSETLRELQAELDAHFPGARLLAKQMEQGPPFGAPVELHVTGPDLAGLFAIAEQLRGVLAGLDGVTHTSASLAGGRPTLQLALDEELAGRIGLGNAGVAHRTTASLDGVLGGSLIEGAEELPVRVRIARDARGDTAHLGSLDLALGPTHRAGRPRAFTSLAALADLSLEPEAAQITHRDGVRSTTVQAYLDAGLLPSRVVSALDAALAERGFELPAGYAMSAGGEAAERDEAVGGLLATVALLLILMATSLVMSFNSFRLAGIIALVGVLAIGLAMLALRLAGFPFGFMSIVGSMGLVGVAINDSIVVLAALEEDPRARRAELSAVVEVTLRASRHVISTTLTTVVGFLPLLLAGGSFWPPVAVTIGGGVLGATQLALTLVPALYFVVVRRTNTQATQPGDEPRPEPLSAFVGG